MIHIRSKTVRDWAVCGAEGKDLIMAEDIAMTEYAVPTCLHCMGGHWVAEETEIARIIERNSVKDIQHAIDMAALVDLMGKA